MKRYPHVLSPLCVRGKVLKSRFVSSNALPHYLQGPETYPNDQVIGHLVSLARNGAAIVTFADWTNPMQRQSPNEDGKRFPMYDLSDPSVENYFCQMTDQIHALGSYMSMAIMPFTAPFPGYDVSHEEPVSMEQAAAAGNVRAIMSGGAGCEELTHEMIREIIEQQAQVALRYKKLGFDMCTLHFAYRITLFARFLSPMTNHRTDEYGGSVAGRARFLIELATRIKELCGQDFLVEVQISATEPFPGGMTIEQTIETAKLCEGCVDIFQFRAGDANTNHPTGYNSREHQYAVLADCAAVKKSGTSILCEPIGGFQDLGDAEEIIASGKADLIGAARALFIDPDYYQKAIEGRGEDVLPCVRCNKCHVPSLEGDWNSICTVNPEIGIVHNLGYLTRPAGPSKRVAIAGGGPAGMRAALMCASRGHDVTIYEASDALGGQLKLMDAPTFKWPLARYRRYLVDQVRKAGIRVLLSTPATPELLTPEGYDVVIAALGATPVRPPVPGAEKAATIFDLFGHEEKFGHRCVVIGGSESGTEAGIYLAENGHETVVLTRQDILAPDATPIHYRETFEEYYATLPTFSFITGASATAIGDGYVEYRDRAGELRRIECDSVVALGGMQPHQQQAMALYPCADRFYMIGDCREVGNVFTANRTAYLAAHQF